MPVRVVVPLVVVLALTGLLGYGLTRDPHTLPSAFQGRPAPVLDLPGLLEPGRRVELSALDGRVGLVNVWASWCVACRSEVTELARLAEQTGVPVIGIDYKDRRHEAARWLRRFGNPYALIAFDRDGTTGIDWGISGVPETFVVGCNGRIRDKIVGPITAEIRRDRLVPLIRRLRCEAAS